MSKRPNSYGKTAKFFFNGRDPVVGKVIHEPAATGDCWILEDPQTGGDVLVYVQQFEYMSLLPETDDDQQN